MKGIQVFVQQNKRKVYKMYLPEQIYSWLVEANIISNQGQIDEKGNVTLPPQQAANLDNGFIVGQVTRRIATLTAGKIPNALATVKSDSAKNTKLTNWNFIWLAFETINLKLDTRIKQLILQGEHALIVQVLRQLHERDPQKKQNSKIVIRQKQNGKPKVGSSQAVDIKKINLNKDPEESESSLQFLILLLKTSLGMNLEEILGLFTNQNKYLAHLIVKGLNDNFDPIILFYSLLNKHAAKLKFFHDQDPRDAEACLYALKPGFISKSQKVAELSLDLFGKLGNIYEWFISEDSKCAGTFLLGVKRHQALRQLYWHLLVEIIEGEELQFFTKYYSSSFQNPAELIQVTTYLLKHIAVSFLGQKITSIGIAASWLETATLLPENDIEAQNVAINFVGELMIYLPAVIEQNEESLSILTRNWQKRSLGEFVTLFNQLIGVLQKLGEAQSRKVYKIYDIIAQIAKVVGAGDKRDYLVQIFVPLISKFTTLPSQRLIQHLKRNPLSSSQYVLVCESIQISQDTQALIAVGNFLKQLFLDNPLINFYVLSLIKQITQKVMMDRQNGSGFIEALLQETLHQYSITEIKYKPRPKQQKSMYFGKSGSPQKISKQNEEELLIKQKWKDLYIGLIIRLTDLAFSEQNDQLRQVIKQKLMNANSYIRLNNHKIGSKQLEDLLNRRFEITKDEQVEHSEEYKQKVVNNMEQSMIHKSKVTSQLSLSNKLKGPENLIKEFQSIVEKRKQDEQGRHALQIKKQLIEQKKKLNVKKQLQITNLLRGQIGQAQLREEGFLQRLMQQPKQTEIIPLDELEQRDLDAIEAIFKKYHRALRHLFLLHTATMYSSHTAQAIEDNQRRKQILTSVELGKFLKEYGFFFLTSQPEINNMVRDINVKLLNRRQVNQLDFTGFQQYIIQFCFLNMTRQHTVTTSAGKLGENVVSVHKQLKGQPIYVILKQFFVELKKTFIAKKEKLSVFEDIQDIPLSKEQAYAVNILNQKLSSSSSYILPKGYKKVVQKSIQFKHYFSPVNYGLQQAFEVALDAMDFILSKSSLKIHVFQSMAEKITTYKVKPTSLGFSDFEPPRERAMSTVIDSKSPLLPDINKNRGSSKGLLTALKPYPSQSSKGLTQGNQVAINSKEKEAVKQKKALSLAKLSQIQKSKFEQMAKKAKQKEFERQQQIQRQKEKQRRRRQQNQKFIQQKKAKLMEKKKKQQEQRQKKFHQQQQKQAQLRQNKQKFKVFHQGQLQRIKRIQIDASDKIRREKEQEAEQKERLEQQRRRLREQIGEQDKKMLQSRKQIQKKLNSIYESQAIKKIFVTYEQNLKALFQFLMSRTHVSLTEKKLNNEIIFDTWRYFLNAFEISPLILNPKDVVFIFKTFTKDKIAPKQYNVGLSFQEFQQALLRIAIKHKSIFNLISKKIKDKIQEEKPIPANEGDKMKKTVKKEGKQSKGQLISEKTKPNSKIPQKQVNQFQKAAEINVKELMKQDSAGIDDIEYYGDLSKVSEKTLRGLIYYLKVPNNKLGQQQRFRSLLLDKPKASIQNSQKLKQKLSEQYTLESPVKKTTVKPGVQSSSNPIVAQPALNEPIRSINL